MDDKGLPATAVKTEGYGSLAAPQVIQALT